MSRTAASSSYLRARLRRLDDSIDGRVPDAERQLRRLRLQRALSEALLAEAIDDAERRCDGLALGLVAFDRRTRLRVDWLRAVGSVREAMIWNPSATRMPAPDSSRPRRRALPGRPRWRLASVPAPRGL